MKQPDVRADHVLDRVEHGGIVHDLVDPGEQEMRLEVMPFAEFLPLRRLEVLHRVPVAPRLIGAERVERIDKALAVIMRDLRVGEFFAHRLCLCRHCEERSDEAIQGYMLHSLDCFGTTCLAMTSILTPFPLRVTPSVPG